jgi:peptide/nickel transport system substrate-binding protein
MNNRFGIKDFFVVVILLAIVAILVMSMSQSDRQWKQQQQAIQKLDEMSQQMARMEQKLAAGVVAAPAGMRGQADASGTRTGADTSWARPGVPIESQPTVAFATDPATRPGFRQGGEVTEIYEAQLQKVVPFVATDVYGRRVLDLVCQSLATYDPQTLKLKGVLAEAWQIDPKGLWLRAKIRDNAVFSDGTPVLAEDLRWTFHDFIMNPQIDAERDRSTLRDSISKVEVISDRVVEFSFIEPLFLNTDNALTLFVLQKSYYSTLTPAEINKGTGLLVGSGPFKMASADKNDQWTPPSDIVLVRNERYWGPRPALDKIRIRCMNDELPRLTAYKNGEADIITPSVPQFKKLTEDPEFVKNNQCLNWTNMRCGNSFIAWNCGERNGKLTPFHDRRVRLAMTHLLDREKMIRDIWKGMGQISKGNFNPNSPSSDPALQPWPYDLNKARALLKEAGWEDRDGNGVIEDKDGREFTFEFTYTGGGEIAERIATFVKDSCAAAGIRCNLKSIDWSVGEDIRKRRDFDATTLAWGANAPESDPKQIYHSDSIRNEGDNFAQWNSPEADKFIEMGRRELDFDKRMKAWHAFERVMHEEQPYTWIRIQAYPRFVKAEIGNVNTYPKGLEMQEFFRSPTALPMSPVN